MNEVFFKRFPCCFATHAALTALLDLSPRPDAGAIEAVDLDVCPTTLLVADQRQPDTGLGGKFSMTYCAASALLRGHVREEHFTAEAVRDPAARALAEPRPPLPAGRAGRGRGPRRRAAPGRVGRGSGSATSAGAGTRSGCGESSA